MFIGAINSHLRSIMWALAPRWKDRPVYVGCSGNFTVERILSAAEVRNVHSNDVSLYSCAIGKHLISEDFGVAVKDERYAWLDPYMQSSLDRIATLMLCSEWFKYADRDGIYYRRMDTHYRANFRDLHAKTRERIAPGLESTRIRSFTAGDVVDYVNRAPRDAVVISFPPTYAGGYEQLYKKFDAVFAWSPPPYTLFDAERFASFQATIREFDHWVTLTDHDVEALRPQLIGIVQTGMRSRPVHVYSNASERRFLAFPRQDTGTLPLPLATGEVTGPLDLVCVEQRVMNTLRSLFLATKIIPAPARLSFLVTAGGKIIGGIACSTYSAHSNWCDVYLLTDLAIRPTPHRRLAKLVLAACLSTEFKRFVEQKVGRRVTRIGTTAFTKAPVSMKYRGIFELVKRGDGFLNYVGEMGKWSLDGGYQWWSRTHRKA